MSFYLKLFLVILFPLSSYATFSTSAKQAILMDIDSNEIIFGKNINKKMTPSSMSKLMTMYLVFSQLRNNEIKLSDKFLVSKKSSGKQGSKMFLKQGQMVSVEDLIRGVIVQSGNDAAIALAEGVAGSEEAFVSRMNIKAKELGLKNSNFVNSTGWPENNHYMTALDLAILSKRIINDFPEYYHYFNEKSFKFNNIKQPNRNPLIYRSSNVDGLKTGHSSKGGYGVSASGTKNGRRLILVVNGLKDQTSRANESYKMLQYGFLNYTNVIIAKKNDLIMKNISTWLSSPSKVDLISSEDIVVTVPVDLKSKIRTFVEYKTPITSEERSSAGKLIVEFPNSPNKTYHLIFNKQIIPQGSFRKMFSKVFYYMKNFSMTQPKEILHKVEIKH